MAPRRATKRVTRRRKDAAVETTVTRAIVPADPTKKPPRGYNTQNLVPLRKGYDPRRNLNGRPPGILSPALHKRLQEHPEEVDGIIDRIILFAKAGNIDYVKLIFDRLEGRAVARQESGGPGDFGNPFAGMETEDLENWVARLERLKGIGGEEGDDGEADGED